jgi:hypothetical protein
MHAIWGTFLVSAAVFGLALGTDWLFVPVPQPVWSLTVSVLRAIELMAAGVAIIALVVILGAWAMLTRLPPDP